MTQFLDFFAAIFDVGKSLGKVWKKIKYDFEFECEPKINLLIKLIVKSYERFNELRKKISYSTETKIILRLNQDNFVVISCNGGGYKFATSNEIESYKQFILIETDSRLLYWILQGPKKAHWNNAEIGSHIQFKRIPDIYEIGLLHCLNYFYSGQYVN